MRTLFFLLAFSSFSCIAQQEDSVCVSARWISLENNETNADLFGNDSTFEDDKDFIRVIKKLVDLNQIHLFRHAATQNGTLDWKYINYPKEFRETELTYDSLGPYLPYFKKFLMEDEIPIEDESGEPLTRVNNDGFEEYVYAPRVMVDMHTRDFDQIKIREVRVVDEITKEVSFAPAEIGFFVLEKKRTFSRVERRKELFWIDFEELKKVAKEFKDYPWYRSLTQIEYKGFQYKQTACGNYESSILEKRFPEVLPYSDSCEYVLNWKQVRSYENFVVRIGENCGDSIKAYFPFGNSTNYLVLNIDDPSKPWRSAGFVKDSDESMYLNFDSKQKAAYSIRMRGCHTQGEFNLIVE